MKMSKLEKKLEARAIRQHMKNELHQYCRIVDDYQRRGMTSTDAAYCAKKKFERLYGNERFK